MIQNFRDNDMDKAIELAIDKAYPIFRMFGWSWWNTDGPPTRWQMEESLVGLTESALESIKENEEVQNGFAGTGRFGVDVHAEDGTLTVSYRLDLSEGYGE